MLLYYKSSQMAEMAVRSVLPRVTCGQHGLSFVSLCMATGP